MKYETYGDVCRAMFDDLAASGERHPAHVKFMLRLVEEYEEYSADENSISELAESLDLHRTTASRNVRKLEDLGWAEGKMSDFCGDGVQVHFCSDSFVWYLTERLEARGMDTRKYDE